MFQTHAPSRADPPPETPARPLWLAKAQLHEVHAAAGDWASAMAFCLAAIEADARRPILLLRVRKDRRAQMRMDPCGEGWSPLGLDPARLLIVDARDDAGLLRAGLDAARQSGPAAVILETWGNLREYDLVASRRLILAAEQSRIPVVMLRGDTPPRASAAHTRWMVSSAPSTPLETRAPGPPALLVELQRRRGGPAGLHWRLEWNEDNACFREEPIVPARAEPGADEAAPLSGAVVSLAAVRAGEPLRRTA
ncbi:ImuA family protein [Novosphingobium sp. P6W]|uniref:ImuA family protein n=1 Tax=Novosphingobium sp. P6W TaxID=1609758 RepID=UPI0005C2F06A|nr:hypothetical protein [Novosphingobium sp. P6W]KIS33962.1 hypothetical protein TQ38_04710 [Novosphingobium sp. P6W]